MDMGVSMMLRVENSVLVCLFLFRTIDADLETVKVKTEADKIKAALRRKEFGKC